MTMKRFSFTTASGPVTSGEGVLFNDGTCVWRERLGESNAYETAIEGALADITARYGGVVGYAFTQQDSVATITSLSPATGGAAGGTAVTITGTGFTGATGVTFGGTAGTSFSVVNATTINVTTPAKSAGTYDVKVVMPAPDPGVTRTAGFVYT